MDEIKLVTDVQTGEAITFYNQFVTHTDIMNDIDRNGYALVQLIIAPADGIICEYQIKEVHANDSV